ncbi:hypothetical protein L21TH_0330 [Caldisalinibacter kiritimatiensis]|uniref:Alkyl hydroperoxide reductase subunit C/ Thiol specific antioxidant domain-containing protein n=1 Tax=Caldisalinibacter kiritimatiensis TaxID=1304284 RepID=R1CSF8_9FIRM|nr:hypothetical protein L21TH_0330 [Caldisalinibacter kiritimatiensis]
MKYPYWYYRPNPSMTKQYPSRTPQPNTSREFPNCIIEEKYCDYFDLGDPAPNFTLDAIVDGERTKVSLSDYLGKWVVIFFYGSNFTFV